LKTLSQQTILSNTGTAPGAYLLTFARKFEFVPGQVIGIAMNPAEKPRLYSIASGNNENVVRILYTVKPEGKLTPDMARLQPGDTIYVSEPFGGFLCNEEEQAVWVATGTGIAPFASMFFSGLSKINCFCRAIAWPMGFTSVKILKKKWAPAIYPLVPAKKWMAFSTAGC
jgi:ferredoxin/flavodoxin---NADP+ reductase